MDIEEEWRWIPGYEGRYEVSDQGRARSWRVRSGRGTSSTPTYLKPVLDTHGYRMIYPSLDGDQRMMYVHHAVLLAFVGPRPEGLLTRHLDGNCLNNRLDNLRYGTKSENSADFYRHKAERELAS